MPLKDDKLSHERTAKYSGIELMTGAWCSTRDVHNSERLGMFSNQIEATRLKKDQDCPKCHMDTIQDCSQYHILVYHPAPQATRMGRVPPHYLPACRRRELPHGPVHLAKSVPNKTKHENPHLKRTRTAGRASLYRHSHTAWGPLV